jgi:hypothetical protein
LWKEGGMTAEQRSLIESVSSAELERHLLVRAMKRTAENMAMGEVALERLRHKLDRQQKEFHRQLTRTWQPGRKDQL